SPTPASVTVRLVVTEHLSALTEERRRRYERTRDRLARVAGEPVENIHYREVADLAGARAVVLSASSAPWAAHDPADLERLGEAVRAYDGPVLGICAGMQLQAMFAGGSVRPVSEAGRKPERGYGEIDVLDDSDLLRGLPPHVSVFQHHTDEVRDLP